MPFIETAENKEINLEIPIYETDVLFIGQEQDSMIVDHIPELIQNKVI